MSNNLSVTEKNLRSLAKRYKAVKYSIGMAILFLMMGVNAFSEEVILAENATVNQVMSKQEIKSTAIKLQERLNELKKQNEKGVGGEKLELIKLMEQGDQVIKNPWSSWQVGTNFYYDNWGSIYRGKGDKKSSTIHKRVELQKRYNQDSNQAKLLSSGTTNITLENSIEPERVIETTISINVTTPKVSGLEKEPSGPTGGIPSFNPITAKEPQAPEVIPPKIEEPAPITYPGFGSSISDKYSFWNETSGGGNGSTMMDQISITSGKFKATSTKGAYIKGFQGQGGYSATSSTLKRGEPQGTIPADGYHVVNSSRRFFFGIRNSAFMQWEPGVEISWFGGGISSGNQLIYMETSTQSEQNLETLNNGGAFAGSEGLYDEVKSYKIQTELKDDGDGARGINLHNNKGDIYLGDSATRYQATTTIGGTRLSVFNNEGTITGLNLDNNQSGENGSKKQVVYFNTPDTSSDQRWIYANGAKGKINLYGSESLAMYFTSSSGSNQQYVKTGFVNNGLINLYGINSSGVMVRESETLKAGSGFYLNKPVNIYSDASRGVYIAGNIEKFDSKNAIVRANIGFDKNDTKGFDWTDIQDGTVHHLESNGNLPGKSTEFVDNAVGIMYTNSNLKTKVQAPEITLEKFSKESIGVYVTKGKLTVESGEERSKININGGEVNVGLYPKGGEIEFNGDITMGGSALTTEGGNAAGKGNIGIFAANGHKATLNGNLKTYNDAGESKDTIGVFAERTTVDLNGSNDIKSGVGESGNSIGIYANGAGGIVNITKPNETKISIDGTGKDLGTALFAGNGGVINANGTAADQGVTINIKNGASAVASMGANSKVNVQNSKISYTGKGYALYTNNGGKIDAQNSEITLDGNAVGFSIRGNGTGAYTSDVNLTGAKFKINSNNVILAGFTNGSSLQLSNFYNTLIGASGLNFNNISGTATTYKIGVIDGLNGANSFTLDEKLDKKVAMTNKDSNSAKYARNFLVQKSRIEVNKDVSASISSADANVLGVSYVNGLDLSSNNGALSNDETIMNVNDVNITADRTDAGAGAVGLYINYGKLNIKSATKIDVETGDNVVNNEAIGVFALNGSEVDNKGTITVKGDKSIGIVGMSYREENGAAIVNEYGAAGAGQGTISLKNEGSINLDGKESVGIFVKNNKNVNNDTDVTNTKGENATGGKIELKGNGSVGMFAEGGTLKNAGNIKLAGTESTYGIFAKDNSSVTNETTGVIEIESATSKGVANVGIFNKTSEKAVTNNGKIKMKDNSFGIISKNVILGANSLLELGKDGIGIYSKGITGANSTLTLDAGSTIKLASSDNSGVGVLTEGTVATTITANGNIEIGDNGYGIISRTPGSITTGVTSTAKLGKNSIYLVSENGASIDNNTVLTSEKDETKGLYTKGGIINNNADINFGVGIGNIGIVSDAGNVTNMAGKTITVGKSDVTNQKYSVGMAAINGGTVLNNGIIKVENESGIGMYATGSGSKAINSNTGIIELSGKNSQGIYVTNGAVAENYGIIRTASNNTKDGIIGINVTSNAIFKNYGQVIIDGGNNTGVLFSKTSKDESKLYEEATITPSVVAKGTITSNGGVAVDEKKHLPTEKTLGNIEIRTKPTYPETKVVLKNPDGTVKELPIAKVDLKEPDGNKIVETLSGETKVIDIASVGNFDSNSNTIKEIGMYVDTSGINHTNPYQGLDKLTSLKKIKLLFGTEATRYTNSKQIEVGKNILKPYNEIISGLSGSDVKFALGSSSLTWFATGEQDANDVMEKVIMKKLSYTVFAAKGDTDTYNLLDGVEQRYGVEGLNSREKTVFNKLNDLGKGEGHIFAQAIDEMSGHQYANVQQRVYSTGSILDKEFNYLRKEWNNPTKNSNKIKTFGMRGEYNTDTAGVIDYTNNAYGVAYVHENETLNLGKTSGWYTGIVENRIKFKDIGGSKEEQLQGKIGVFKSIPFDYDNSLNWTVSGELSLGYNKMNRRFWVVDDVFNAKSRYWNYGAAIKNEVSKDFRLSEDFSFKPYASAKVEYGRISKIREKSGEIRLEVKSNDYYSIKPEIGSELIFKHVANNKTFKATLGIAYENELGKIADGKNKARVLDTTADWFNIRGEKEDRHGNVKTDLKLGIDNSIVGLTANIGYDTKGRNVRGGVGLRVIF